MKSVVFLYFFLFNIIFFGYFFFDLASHLYIIISDFVLLWIFFVHICVFLCVFLVLVIFNFIFLLYLPVYFLNGKRKEVGVG